MTLVPDDIVRYSRQILLKEVGGQGQEALLRAHIDVEGSSQTFLAAAAYLTAGGSQVANLTADRSFGFGGFEEIPPSSAPPCFMGTLSGPFLENTSKFQVVVGTSEGIFVVVYATAMACRECLEATVAPLAEVKEGVEQVFQGALAALVCQRIILGLSEELGALSFSWEDGLKPRSWVRCQKHA